MSPETGKGTGYARNQTPEEATVPSNIKNEKQYEALKDKGMSKERAAKIANSPDASRHGGEQSHSGSGRSDQGGTHAQNLERVPA